MGIGNCYYYFTLTTEVLLLQLQNNMEYNNQNGVEIKWWKSENFVRRKSSFSLIVKHHLLKRNSTVHWILDNVSLFCFHTDHNGTSESTMIKDKPKIFFLKNKEIWLKLSIIKLMKKKWFRKKVKRQNSIQTNKTEKGLC